MRHHCHALGCSSPCNPRCLMCDPHWQIVPPVQQEAVRRAYRPGQTRTKTPAPDWLLAATDARISVARHERRDLRYLLNVRERAVRACLARYPCRACGGSCKAQGALVEPFGEALVPLCSLACALAWKPADHVVLEGPPWSEPAFKVLPIDRRETLQGEAVLYVATAPSVFVGPWSLTTRALHASVPDPDSGWILHS